MTDKQHRTGDLSRRDFIKTATVATAGVSAGVMPEPTQKSNPQAQTEWSISGREIQTLWTKIWPKIVALSWDNPHQEEGDGEYKRYFEESMNFRKKEVERIAGYLDESALTSFDFPIRVAKPSSDRFQNVPRRYSLCLDLSLRDSSGNTFFVLNPYGLLMPWPEKPEEPSDLYAAYFLSGGTLPSNDSIVADPFLKKLKEEVKWDEFEKDTGDLDDAYSESGMSGIGLLKMIDNWSRVTSLYWRYSPMQSIIENQPKSFLMPEVLSNWDFDQYKPYTDKDLEDFNITVTGAHDEIRIGAPLPEAPDLYQMFDELIIGHATNPMYTGCY